MRMTTTLGMGYLFSETNRRISSASESNIVMRAITGHELPIQVHQHYGLEFHLILKPNYKHDGLSETCMRRGFLDFCNARKVCLQLQKVHCKDFVRVYITVDGSCLCLIMSSSFTEPKPIETQNNLCNCSLCTPHTEDMLTYSRWMDKAFQDCMEKQQDICCCREIDNHYELMG